MVSGKWQEKNSFGCRHSASIPRSQTASYGLKLIEQSTEGSVKGMAEISKRTFILC